MTNVARLSSIGTCFAFEFDDYTNTTFSMSGLSTVFASEFDENVGIATTLSGNQRMSATSTGGVIVLDSINEIDPFEDITEINLELHLDSFVSPFSTVGTPTGQQLFTSSGTFTVPSGVTSIAVVCVGAGGGGGGSEDDDETGGGGGGGALAYVNNITTTPGESLTVTVGTGGGGGGAGGGNGSAGGNSSLSRGGTTLAQANGGGGGQNRGSGGSGGTVNTGTGGAGGDGGAGSDRGTTNAGGGGGAGGYSGAGGDGSDENTSNPTAGSGGGGGGGLRSSIYTNVGGGGGVGVLGEGASGAAGDVVNPGGGGGSGGQDGHIGFQAGGLYGGGGAGAATENAAGWDGSDGAVRIIWGTGRSFPSTLTTDQTTGSSSPVWEDLTANSRDLILLDGADKVGNFVNFDGVDDYGIINGNSGNSYNGVTGTSARTSILIFRIDTPNTDYKPLAWGTTTTGQKWTMAISSSNLMRGEVDGADIEQPTTHRDNVVNVADGQWHMVAISAPASGTVNDMRMWIDGVEVTGLTVTNGATSINTSSANNLSVGASLVDASPQFLDGEIEKVMVYSQALVDLEIKHIYQSVLNRLPWVSIASGGGGGTPTPDLGLSASLLQLTGINASYTQQTVDISDYANATVRLVWRVVIGTTGSVFQNDVQLDTIAITGESVSYDFDAGTESFETTINGNSTDYSTASFTALQTQTTAERWNRNSGNTGSNNTGNLGAQSGTFYVYTESSSPVINGDYFWLRSPEITLGATPGNVTFYEGREITGANTTLDFYIDVVSV